MKIIVLFLSLACGIATPLKVISKTDTERLRGTMIPPLATARDLRDLAALGANHVRWQLTWGGFPHSPADTATPSAYRAWLRGTLRHVRQLLPLCDSLGIQVTLDLHTLPGGAQHQKGETIQHRIFNNRHWQGEFIRIWEEIAITFRNAPAIWAYDLANEPVEGKVSAGLLNWQQLAVVTSRAIRALDPKHTIVLEGTPGGGRLSLLRFQPLTALPNLVYSFHFYDPVTFTHQGIINKDTLRYPGNISGNYWDSTALRKALQPVRDWQLAHNAEIYVGEFSAVRWAPDSSAYYYLRDCISIFEDWGWSWAFHAWREWDGWSVEHGEDRNDAQPTSEPTDRILLLKEAFRKN